MALPVEGSVSNLNIDLSGSCLEGHGPSPEMLAFEERLVEIQREIHSVIPPLKHQLPILNAFFKDWLEGVFLRCGRKFSKTHCVTYCSWVFALLFPGSENYIIFDERDHGRSIIWDNGRLPRFLTTIQKRPDETIEQWSKRKALGKKIEQKYVASVINSDLTLRFRNGSFISIEGAKNVPKADGLQPTFICYDEFKSHDERFDISMRPNLDVFEGRLLIVGTPPPLGESPHYLKTEEEFKRSPKKRHFCLPSYLNEVVYPNGRTGEKFKALEVEYRARNEYHVFAREYLGLDIADSSKRIFPHFTRSDHVHDHQQMLAQVQADRRAWDYYLVFDPGTTSVFAATAIAIHTQDRRFFVLGEVYETDMSKTTVGHIWPKAEEIARAINPNFEDWVLGYDVAASWFANEVAAQFGEALLPCDKSSRTGLGKEDQLSVLRSAMVTGRFAISEKCEHTIKEIVRYALDDNGRLPKKDDHGIDTMRYTMRFDSYDTVFHASQKVPTFKELRPWS